jgi:hypothetical protein
MHARFTPKELAARREIEAKIATAPTEEEKDRLREDRQAITHAARARLKARVAKKNAPPPPKPVKPVFTLTSAQKEARANWSNQYTSAAERRTKAAAEVAVAQAKAISRTRVYRLFDGTLFYADNGEVISAVPQGCRVFAACDPPHYIQNSHVIAGFYFDELISHWRQIPQKRKTP